MTTIDTQHSTQDLAGSDGPGAPTPGVPTEDFLIESYLQPASIKAVSHLAEDTIAATGELAGLKDEPGTVAVFQNPFTGVEEILYVETHVENHEDYGSLYWVRKTDDPEHPWRQDNGWSQDLVASGVESFAVVVHPNGKVFAFCTIGSSSVTGFLSVVELTQLADGSLDWVDATIDMNGATNDIRASLLFVQYLTDRPATPVVFAVDITQFEMPYAFIIAPTVAGQSPNGESWQFRWDFRIHADDIAGLGALGVDDEHMLTARAYSRHADSTLWRTVTIAPWQGDFYLRTEIDLGWQSIADVWSSPDGAGCVGLSSDGYNVVYNQPNTQPSTDGFIKGFVALDMKSEAVSVWSDSSALLHVYCRTFAPSGAVGDVRVLHQSGWTWLETTGGGRSIPVWETYQNEAKGTVGFARALFAHADRFVADPYPDDMPSQLVLTKLGTADEAASIYTQQQGTNYWEREVVRWVPKLPENKVALSLVNRYQTRVTVLNSYGSPVPMCPVTLTSDGPVDLEVAGRFYRTSETTPVTITTDFSGSLILRVLADGLSAPSMHLSVSGVVESLTVQPAAGVQKFLGGNGTLPNHPEGLSAWGIKAAANRDGSVLFPALHPSDNEAWSPSPQDVFTWFQAAFATSARQPLPPAMRAKLADEEVVAFSLQTHDHSRPVCEAFSEAQIEAHRQALRDQGLLDDASEWFGDLVEGLRSGVVLVSQVVVDVKKRTLDVLVDLGIAGSKWMRGVWKDPISAAHAVEAMCAALGAAIWQVLDWLSWRLGLADIWRTKKALQAKVDELPDNLKAGTKWMRSIGTGWTNEADQAITDAFAGIREALGGLTFGALGAVPPTVTETDPLGTASLRDWFDSPLLWWWQDLLNREFGNSPTS